MVAAGSVTALAVGAEIEPGRIVMGRGGIEAFLLLADVAREAMLVPDLGLDFAAFVGVPDIEIVEPLLSENVPTGRQHDDASVGERRQVVLDAPAAERVVNPVLYRFSVEVGLGDVVSSTANPQCIWFAAKRKVRLREIPLDTGSRCGLNHLAMARA